VLSDTCGVAIDDLQATSYSCWAPAGNAWYLRLVVSSELTDDERKVLEGVVQHQVAHPGHEAPLDELRLLFTVEEDEKAGSIGRSLAERLLVSHRQERSFEFFDVTPEGLLTSQRAEEVRRVSIGLLRLFQTGIQKQRTEFSSFTLGELGLGASDEYAVAQLVVRAFELHGHLAEEFNLGVHALVALSEVGSGAPSLWDQGLAHEV
jgi:hypothetical protein